MDFSLSPDNHKSVIVGFMLKSNSNGDVCRFVGYVIGDMQIFSVNGF